MIYLKTNFIKENTNYIENKYIKIPEFEPNSEFKYYEDINRQKFNPKKKFFIHHYKEIFLTGPHGIGKSLSVKIIIKV